MDVPLTGAGLPSSPGSLCRRSLSSSEPAPLLPQAPGPTLPHGSCETHCGCRPPSCCWVHMPGALEAHHVQAPLQSCEVITLTHPLSRGRNGLREVKSLALNHPAVGNGVEIQVEVPLPALITLPLGLAFQRPHAGWRRGSGLGPGSLAKSCPQALAQGVSQRPESPPENPVKRGDSGVQGWLILALTMASWK